MILNIEGTFFLMESLVFFSFLGNICLEFLLKGVFLFFEFVIVFLEADFVLLKVLNVNFLPLVLEFQVGDLTVQESNLLLLTRNFLLKSDSSLRKFLLESLGISLPIFSLLLPVFSFSFIATSLVLQEADELFCPSFYSVLEDFFVTKDWNTYHQEQHPGDRYNHSNNCYRYQKYSLPSRHFQHLYYFSKEAW